MDNKKTIKRTEVERDDKRVEQVVKNDDLSPIVCKSPQPRTLFFEESNYTLSSLLSDKVGSKRTQNFTPRQNLKRVKILCSISSFKEGDNFAYKGLESTPMSTSHLKVRKNLMQQFGDIMVPDYQESANIGPETTVNFLEQNESNLLEFFLSELGYDHKTPSDVYQKSIFNLRLSANMPVFVCGEVKFINELHEFQPTLVLARKMVEKFQDDNFIRDYRLEVSNEYKFEFIVPLKIS